MQEHYSPSPFARADQAFFAALPKRSLATDEDLAKIKLPGFRYDEIDQAVSKMYEKADVRTIPLQVNDIVDNLGCSIIPYRFLGPRIHDMLLKASLDAVTMKVLGSMRHVIFYNDRRPQTRINFTLLHEIGHIELGHQEQSQLAEIEANPFAAVALCPLDLLEHFQISDPRKIAELFDISEECAKNRLCALNNSRNVARSSSQMLFRREIIKRFKFMQTIQRDFFEDCGT